MEPTHHHPLLQLPPQMRDPAPLTYSRGNILSDCLCLPRHEGRASSSSEGLIVDHSLTFLPPLSSHWCRASSSSKGLSDCLPIPLLSPVSLHECRRARARRGSSGTSLSRNLGELELRWCCNGWRKAWRAWWQNQKRKKWVLTYGPHIFLT